LEIPHAWRKAKLNKSGEETLGMANKMSVLEKSSCVGILRHLKP
jgi:hypothetical protein